ncbi:MAG: hypothetical protein M3441_13635 [Chloroflexota bacterium]|nr:hypothetical protein [Chloroflexota bacterium]
MVQELRSYAQAEHADGVQRCLERYLPDWPVRQDIVIAARELVLLKSNTDIARRKGVPNRLADEFVKLAQNGLESLWSVADGVAGMAAQRVEYEQVRHSLARQAMTMQKLGIASEQARIVLAHKSLSEAEADALNDAQVGLRALAEAITALDKSTRL